MWEPCVTFVTAVFDFVLCDFCWISVFVFRALSVLYWFDCTLLLHWLHCAFQFSGCALDTNLLFMALLSWLCLFSVVCTVMYCTDLDYRAWLLTSTCRTHGSTTSSTLSRFVSRETREAGCFYVNTNHLWTHYTISNSSHAHACQSVVVLCTHYCTQLCHEGLPVYPLDTIGTTPRWNKLEPMHKCGRTGIQLSISCSEQYWSQILALFCCLFGLSSLSSTERSLVTDQVTVRYALWSLPRSVSLLGFSPLAKYPKLGLYSSNPEWLDSVLCSVTR